MSCADTDFPDVCTVRTRDTTVKFGGSGADQFTDRLTDEPCLFKERPGRESRQGDNGRDIVWDGILRIRSQVISTDQIVIGDFKYFVGQITPIKDPFTQIIEYYKVRIAREKSDSATKITIG